MIYSSGEKKLNCIRKVLENETNDVWIAQDIAEKSSREYYTLLVVKKHETAKFFMEIVEQGIRDGRNTNVEISAYQDDFCIIYPYKKERALEQFYRGEIYSGQECEQICKNLIAECVSCGEAWPVLYLILKQNQIHIEKDNSVYFGYQLNLNELDEEIDEKACVMKCAGIVLKLMQENAGMEKTIGRKLIQKKMVKEGYAGFADLFRDIHLDSDSWEKVTLKERVFDFFRTKSRIILKILMCLSILLGIIAVLMILSQMLFGDIPFLRIFTNSFKTIGSESLLN